MMEDKSVFPCVHPLRAVFGHDWTTYEWISEPKHETSAHLGIRQRGCAYRKSIKASTSWMKQHRANISALQDGIVT